MFQKIQDHFRKRPNLYIAAGSLLAANAFEDLLAEEKFTFCPELAPFFAYTNAPKRA